MITYLLLAPKFKKECSYVSSRRGALSVPYKSSIFRAYEVWLALYKEESVKTSQMEVKQL
jgi:hypothetical protein